MGQSKKTTKDGLQPQTIYALAPSAKEKHPKKVVFNPPALQRQEADLKEVDIELDEPKKERHNDELRQHRHDWSLTDSKGRKSFYK